jgi:hypothetical protein
MQLAEFGILPAVASGEDEAGGRILGHLKSLRDSADSGDSSEVKATELRPASVTG